MEMNKIMSRITHLFGNEDELHSIVLKNRTKKDSLLSVYVDGRHIGDYDIIEVVTLILENTKE